MSERVLPPTKRLKRARNYGAILLAIAATGAIDSNALARSPQTVPKSGGVGMAPATLSPNGGAPLPLIERPASKPRLTLLQKTERQLESAIKHNKPVPVENVDEYAANGATLHHTVFGEVGSKAVKFLVELGKKDLQHDTLRYDTTVVPVPNGDSFQPTTKGAIAIEPVRVFPFEAHAFGNIVQPDGRHINELVGAITWGQFVGGPPVPPNYK